MRLIFATNNIHKFSEIKEILGEKYKDFIFSLKDIDIYVDPIEDGKSFSENADIKSYAIYDEMKKQKKLKKDDFIIADDTGLCIDYLDGAPGIMSARFMGKDTLQDIKNQKIIDLMNDVKDDKRNAHFTTCLSVLYIVDIDKLPIKLSFEGRVDGKIAKKLEGTGGFGYDPIFAVDGITYSNLGKDGKNAISHRKRAISAFVTYLEKNHNI